MTPRVRRLLRWAGLLLLATAGALVYLASVAPPALADNCGTLADCFAVASAMANAASAAATIAPVAMAAGAAGTAAAAAQAAPATSPAAAAGADIAAQARVASALGQAPVAPPASLPPPAPPPPPAAAAAAPPPPPGPRAVRALEDVVPAELASDPDFIESWRPGWRTNVMVVVDLPATAGGRATTIRRAMEVRTDRPGNHAEEVALLAGDLRWAVDEALRAGSPERPAVVRVLVNRSPCTTCSPLLAAELEAVMNQLTAEQQASVRFEVLSTGGYEQVEKIPEDEAHLYGARRRYTDLATRASAVERLLESGWDTRALTRRGVLSENGEMLAGAIDHMRQYMGLPPADTTLAPAPAPSPPVEQAEGYVTAALRGEQFMPPPEQVATALRGEPAPPVPAPLAAPDADPVAGPAEPVAAGDAARAELAAARGLVPSPQAARTAVDAAHMLSRQVADLAADPATTVPTAGVAHPVLQAAFDASTLAYDAATGAHQAYDAAYRAAQLADEAGSPAVAEAGRHAEATHALSQRTKAEYQGALAANDAAQQGGPPAVQHAAQAAAHAEQATSLLVQASDAAGRAVDAAAQPAGEADPARDIQAAARAVDEARSTLPAVEQQVERLVGEAVAVRRFGQQAAPGPAGEAVASAVRVAYEAAQVAVRAAEAASRAADGAARAYPATDRTPFPVVDASDSMGAANAQAQAAVQAYEAARAAASGTPSGPDDWAWADEVAGHAMRTTDSAVRALGAASDAVRAGGRALTETGRAADVWPNAAVPTWLRPAGEAVPSPAAPVQLPADIVERSAEYPVMAGDLVAAGDVTSREHSAVWQALAGMVENRTYGDGFSVRLRNVEMGRNETIFKANIFHGGLQVGEIEHSLHWSGPTLSVRHGLVKIFDDDLHGHGFGTAWNGHLIGWYYASGVDHISFRASYDGKYVWARLGCRWTREDEARAILQGLEHLLGEPDVTPSEAAAARELLDRAARFSWGVEGFPTVAEVADLGREEQRPAGAHERHIGRRVLLESGGWEGRMDLR